MAATQTPVDIKIPPLPVEHGEVIEHLAGHPETRMLDLVQPFKEYDAEMRKVFAQDPHHEAVKHPNIVPVFAGFEGKVRTRARDIEKESTEEKERYIMPLPLKDRRPDGSPAIVQSLQEFKTNLTVFSESSLVDLDWSNVVVAGSAVTTCLLPTPEEHVGSKRSLRQYYHEKIAPASDVDLFLYGLTEEEAIEKIRQIERNVRDALLVETTTIRTKNTITIASQHPVRHVQIVLRIYKSISEILTGFDVDCSCVAYDGKQVYASPRALAAYMTQINTIDLTRRSPSYENRLSKYANRGFEIYWPSLDRSRVDPTIFERSFTRTQGLARLLVLEKLPRNEDRETYLDQRRAERGRPAINRWRMRKRQIPGDIKNDHEDEVAEWADEDVSNYHSVTIPYGPKVHARKIEKLLFKKDLLLNAEWNKSRDREVNLHRHPAFFGRVEDVIHDCCGFCPHPVTVEEEEVAEEESKTFVSGEISFLKDDPGRQEIGSFTPLTADDWTTMAYVGNTALLCQAIVDGDLEYVQAWLDKEGNDPNTRDFTGRTPLHLAVTNSTVEIVQALIDSGARLIARLVDGKTALHLAAIRGRVDMVSALLRKSEANEEQAEEKVDARRAARKAAKEAGSEDSNKVQKPSHNANDSDIEMVDTSEADDENMDRTTEGSIVDIRPPPTNADDQVLAKEDEDGPDVYDMNITAWDTAVSPLHLAIAKGHIDVVKCLVQDFGADVLLPIKLFNEGEKSARAAILTLVLALQLPTKKAEEMTRTLFQLGTSSAQASIDQTTVLQYCVATTPEHLDTLGDVDMAGVMRAINHLSVSANRWNPQTKSPLMTAIEAKNSATAIRLLGLGARPEIDFRAYMKAWQTRHEASKDSTTNRHIFEEYQPQPVLSAIRNELPLLAKCLIEDHNVNPNTLTEKGHQLLHKQHPMYRQYNRGMTLLDEVRRRLKDLREWKHEVDLPACPMPLEDDVYYLSSFKPNTYALWSAAQQLEMAKQKYEQDLESYESGLETNNDPTGVSEKQEAIFRSIKDFEQLETILVQNGAKEFYELHPEIEPPEEKPRRSYGYHKDKPKPFSVELNFQLGDLDEQSQRRYEQLFEAAWDGDLSQIRRLTLLPWQNELDEDEPPCRASVSDQHGLSPLVISVLRGHYDVTSSIMEIISSQYSVTGPPKNRRYAIDPGDSEDDPESEGEGDVGLSSDIVDDDHEFTVENVGEVSTRAESDVLPTEALLESFNFGKEIAAGKVASKDDIKRPESSYKGTWEHQVRRNSATSRDKATKSIPDPSNLIQLAMYDNNPALLDFLLDLGKQYNASQPRRVEAETSKTFEVSREDFEYALKVDHAHLISAIVKNTGAGIPLRTMAEKYGGELKERPKYYQGLSVYGKKRKDWAQRGDHNMVFSSSHDNSKPLLTAAYFGSLEAVEWFLSDSPIRCYKDFAETNKDDKRLTQISLAKDGFQDLVEKFLKSESEKAMHCCIAGHWSPEADSTLRYLLRAMPDTLESRSGDGFTPLQVAFEKYREPWAKLLIEAGADQTCRDKDGRNILHSLLNRVSDTEEGFDDFKRMLDLIDRRVLTSLFVERSIGSLTPLHYWLNRSVRLNPKVAELILEYGHGRELSFINGAGDTPLHHSVKESLPGVTQIILDHDPTLLNRENATGRTPYEMAEDRALAHLCNDPPPLPNDPTFLDRRAERLGLDPDCLMPLLNRPPKSFVEEPVDSASRTEKIWTMVQETKIRLESEGRWKRRLVTLNEANEVARRLTASRAKVSEKREEPSARSVDFETHEYHDQVRSYMEGLQPIW